MRWLLAGLFFALAVTLAIGTAAIRADNLHRRRVVERGLRSVQDRVVERVRWQVLRSEAVAPDRLAEMLRERLELERARREARL